MMTKSQLAAALVPIIVLVILVSACTDQDLVTVSKALKDTAQRVAVLQNIVIAANSQHLLSNAVTRQLLEAALGPIIVLVILVSACTDQDLVTVSKALKDTAQ